MNSDVTSMMTWRAVLTVVCFVFLQGKAYAPGPCIHNCDGHIQHLAHCMALNTHWDCHPDGICQVWRHGDTVKLECLDDHHKPHCWDNHAHNPPECSLSPTDHVHAGCGYCCHDEHCIQRLLIGNYTQVPPQPQPPHGPHPCFSPSCDHLRGTDLINCASQSYMCGPTEFCKIDVHHGNGDIHMTCENRAHHYDHCLDQQYHHPQQCNPFTYPPPGDCHFCCLDKSCMQSTFSAVLTTTTTTTTAAAATTTTLSPATTTSQRSTASIALQTSPPPTKPVTTTKTTLPTTTTTTTTAAPTTASTTYPPCVDHYAGDCSVDFAGRCSDRAVQTVCPKFCAICKTPCVDLFTGDCGTTFAGQCGDHTVAEVCQNTCKLCHTWECKDHYNGPDTCSVAFPGQCSDPLIAAVCQKTCGQCSPSTVPPTQSTTPPPPPSCVQCGNYSSQTPCDNLELLMDTVTQCQDPSDRFCMTDVHVDAGGMVSTYKRCVSNLVCANEWYLQTSDKTACLTFDPTGAPRNIACHYCCVSDACNVKTVPDHQHWWHPFLPALPRLPTWCMESAVS